MQVLVGSRPGMAPEAGDDRSPLAPTPPATRRERAAEVACSIEQVGLDGLDGPAGLERCAGLAVRPVLAVLAVLVALVVLIHRGSDVDCRRRV
ncbi:MAG: hypothetical protein AB7G23_11990 [Vicinamibacterales bacterium]